MLSARSSSTVRSIRLSSIRRCSPNATNHHSNIIPSASNAVRLLTSAKEDKDKKETAIVRRKNGGLLSSPTYSISPPSSSLSSSMPLLHYSMTRTFTTTAKTNLPISSLISRSSGNDGDVYTSNFNSFKHKYSYGHGGIVSNRLHSNHDFQNASLLFQRTMHNVIVRAFSTAPSPNTDEKEDGASVSSSAATTSSTSSTPSSTTTKATTSTENSSNFNSTTITTTTTTTTPTKVPTPKPPSTSSSSNIPTKVKDAIISASKSLASFILQTPSVLWFYLTHPKEFKSKLTSLKEAAKKEANHYWMGCKLLAADIRTARQMLQKTLQGSPLSRRERKQLLRTLADLFRIVPMSIFVIIPFMEFALPFALRIWPNMLPSTFQDSLKAEENMKRELQSRINLAGFFQETLHEMAKDQKRQAAKKKNTDSTTTSTTTTNSESTDSAESLQAAKEESAASFLDFLEKARKGEMMPPEIIIKYSNYFHDELTLDNMPRMQLINMCKYMAIPPYGSNNLLRFQLRHRIRTLKEDDQRILWEGIDSLTKMELREACRERGMRSTGLSKMSYKRALQQWLDLSVNKEVPVSLLIMSRTFFLQDEMVSGSTIGLTKDDTESHNVASLAEAMSGLDKDLVNEVVLQMATPEEKAKDPEIRKIQLEVLEHQNEVIKEEQEEREKEAEEKKAAKKEKAKGELETAEEVSHEIAEANAQEFVEVTPPSTETVVKEEKVVVTAEVAAEVADETKIDFETTVQPESAKADASTTETVPDAEVVSEEEKKETTPEAEKEGKEAEEETEEEEKEEDLSSRDLDAISQLASRNPVQSERDDLERIKAAMAAEDGEEEEVTTEVVAEVEVPSDDIVDVPVTAVETETVTATSIEREEPVVKEEILAEHDVPSEDEDVVAAQTIAEMDAEAEKEAASTTAFSTEGEIKAAEVAAAAEEVLETTEQEEEEGTSSGDEKLDKAINRLKAKVESMVGKIETQLSDVETKIGDKLHILDKDMDGLLTTEEVAESLQKVLKRELTLEQAKAIAADMDTNEDGVLTVKELAMWVEMNKVLKLMEEGRDAEVDRLIIEQAEKLKALENKDSEEILAEKEKAAES